MSVCVCTRCEKQVAPSPIREGEAAVWTWTFCGYSAADYALQVRFRGGGAGVDVTATADGDDFALELTAAVTATFTPGPYEWQAWLTETADPDNKFVVGTGRIDVRPGFIAGETTTLDLRSKYQRTLDAIDDALIAFATSDVVEYEIETPAGRRRLKRSDKANLMVMRKEYAKMVSLERTRERVRNGGSLMRSVGIVVKER